MKVKWLTEFFEDIGIFTWTPFFAVFYYFVESRLFAISSICAFTAAAWYWGFLIATGIVIAILLSPIVVITLFKVLLVVAVFVFFAAPILSFIAFLFLAWLLWHWLGVMGIAIAVLGLVFELLVLVVAINMGD